MLKPKKFFEDIADLVGSRKTSVTADYNSRIKCIYEELEKTGKKKPAIENTPNPKKAIGTPKKELNETRALLLEKEADNTKPLKKEVKDISSEIMECVDSLNAERSSFASKKDVESMSSTLEKNFRSEIKQKSKSLDDKVAAVEKESERSEKERIKAITKLAEEINFLKIGLKELNDKIDALAIDNSKGDVQERVNAIETPAAVLEQKIQKEKDSTSQSINVIKKAIETLSYKLNDVVEKENNLFIMTRKEFEDTRAIENKISEEQKETILKMSKALTVLADRFDSLEKEMGSVKTADASIDSMMDAKIKPFEQEIKGIERKEDILEKSMISSSPTENIFKIVDDSTTETQKKEHTIDSDLNSILSETKNILFEISTLLEDSETSTEELSAKKDALTEIADMMYMFCDAPLAPQPLNALSVNIYLVLSHITKNDAKKVKEAIEKCLKLIDELQG